jgi:hypothetical protein
MTVNWVNPLPPAEQKLAALYGQLVSTAYDMYDNNRNNPTPPWPSQLPGNYQFVAWVQMKDFFIWQGPYEFYGLLAQSPDNVNDYVLAIRGTSDTEEWWDDFRSLTQVPMPNFGPQAAYVGTGFLYIYQTMQVVPLDTDGRSPSASLEAAGSLVDQVAAAIQLRAARSTPPGQASPQVPVNASVTVVGHSLGSALATLCVADNSVKQKFQTPLLCTLASPCVGDPGFASNFDLLSQRGVASWRIVNDMDIIPNTPFDTPFYTWQHIQTEYEFDSYQWTEVWPECYHSIYTYLHALDPTLPPQTPPTLSWWQGCYYPPIPPSMASRARKRRAVAASLPATAAKEIAVTAPAGTTINITIKVG